MTTPVYNLRTRLNSPAISIKTPTASPISRNLTKSPRKQSAWASALQLKHVIGTTTSNPCGLSCCEATNSFAYCAGSVAVYATLDSNGTISYRYFKARPTAVAVHLTTSYYDSTTNTPTKRKSIFTPKRVDDKSFTREWLDESGGHTWSARERIKTATCVSISPDGKLLAVGETGYHPRVLIFGTSLHMSTETPLSILTEHSFGVRSVAFSPDSKYLATLGDVNDGYLYIWTVNSKTGEVKLDSTNKCTVNICDMSWVGGNLVTVGTRHVKVWAVTTCGRLSPSKRYRTRLDGELAASPAPTTLQGRNCLLGKMVDSTFTAIVATSDEMALVCSDDGYICQLDLAKGGSELLPVQASENAVAAISFRRSTTRVVWAGGGHSVLEKNATAFQTAIGASSPSNSFRLRKKISRPSLLRESLGLSHPRRANIVALGCLGDHTISIDADGKVSITSSQATSAEPNVGNLTSHQDLIRGVSQLPASAELGAFMTWSRSGELRFWSLEGHLLETRTIELEQVNDDDEPGTNELRIVRYAEASKLFLTGDRYGVLRFLSRSTWTQFPTIRAHSAEINDIDVFEPTSLVTTCSRDRMVQLFKRRGDDLELIHTSDDHISAVHHVAFNDGGNRLVSCSADRTVIIRERMERQMGQETLIAFISARVVTLKSSPLSMMVSPQDINTMFVSTMDRHIVKIDLTSGASTDSFKVTDSDSDDTTILNSVCLSTAQAPEDVPFLAGYSTIDKSIRVYDVRKGTLLGRDSGHTEGVSDIALLETENPDGLSPHRTIVSTGLDSTIMIWSVSTSTSSSLTTPLTELSQSQAELQADSPVKTSSASLPPMRKILSKMDIVEFARNSSPTREGSPNRPLLRRQTSRLAVATSIRESDEFVPPTLPKPRSREASVELQKKSPSPPSSVRLKRQRSQNDLVRDSHKTSDFLNRSPSPPATTPSAPTTPKHQRANNGRLRRPPSMPGNLRDSAIEPKRRQSMTATSDFGSIGMASEQACRMLKTYRRRLQSARGEMDLDDIERELEAVLRAVRNKRDPTKQVKSPASPQESVGRMKHEVDGLTTLMEKTTI